MKEQFFKVSWKNAQINPPTEIGRYWCYVEEITDLGISHYQWNCAYNPNDKRWSDNSKNVNVVYWTELLPNPNLLEIDKKEKPLTEKGCFYYKASGCTHKNKKSFMCGGLPCEFFKYF